MSPVVEALDGHPESWIIDVLIENVGFDLRSGVRRWKGAWRCGLSCAGNVPRRIILAARRSPIWQGKQATQNV
jgi:hypothetical protein